MDQFEVVALAIAITAVIVIFTSHPVGNVRLQYKAYDVIVFLGVVMWSLVIDDPNTTNSNE